MMVLVSENFVNLQTTYIRSQ